MMKKINKPDLNAPRFRPTRKTVCDNEFFENFRKKFPQYEHMENAALRKIISTHSQLMYEEVTEYRDGVEFPEGTGFAFIGTCKTPKNHLTDYPTSIKYDTLIQHRNFESDNYIAKIFYTNYASKYKFRNRELWQFKGTRDFTRLVSKTYPENWKKYIQVENFQKINKFYQKSKARDYYAKKLKVDVLDYNEFEMN
jgi:hypothetical protein